LSENLRLRQIYCVANFQINFRKYGPAAASQEYVSRLTVLLKYFLCKKSLVRIYRFILILSQFQLQSTFSAGESDESKQIYREPDFATKLFLQLFVDSSDEDEEEISSSTSVQKPSTTASAQMNGLTIRTGPQQQSAKKNEAIDSHTGGLTTIFPRQ
jgi:hypothetical protein